MIGETLWRTRFGSSPTLVGSMITLDNERYQVVGIVPAQSTWPAGAALWFPFTFDPAQLQQARGAVYLNVTTETRRHDGRRHRRHAGHHTPARPAIPR